MENAMTDASEGLHVDERRLAAILAADVAGYSRLMGRNEDETVRDLEAHQAVILPLIAKHGGSIINVAGDGVVAQFPSAVRAVECAAAIQKIMAERNFDVPAERRMLLRIGVNLGDIIHDGTRTYGDGINVAARLEPLAEPGGICISANVRDAIFGKLGLPLRDIGEKTLKNIDRPVHVYEIQPPGSRARRDWLGGALRHYRRLAPALGLIVLIAALGGFGAWCFWPRDTGRPEYSPVVAVSPSPTPAATRVSMVSARASGAKSQRCWPPTRCSGWFRPRTYLHRERTTSGDDMRSAATLRRAATRCASARCSPTRQAVRPSGRTATSSTTGTR